MGCLDNLIGINRVCDEVESLSGFAINDLPGMSIKIAESIITEEDISGKTLIQDKIAFAQKYITSDIRNFLQDRFYINSILSSQTAGIYKLDGEVISLSAGKFRGFRIVVNEYSYTETNISRIGIKLTAAITDKIYIYDLTNGVLLDEIDFTSVANEIVYLDVNKKYKGNNQRQNLFICIDASIANQYATYSGSKGCTSCNKSNLICYETSGYTTGQKIDANFTSASGSGGLTVDYNVSCDIERFVCSMAQVIARPLLYKAGAEILKELKYSKNLNSVVLIDRENTEELLTEYEAEYTNSMNNICRNLKIPDNICFRCDAKIRKVIQIP